MAEDFCEREQLPKAMCAHCRADRRVVTAVPPDFAALADAVDEEREISPFIEALYSGTCRGCGGRWEPGDFIAYSAGEGRWICADCARL